MAFGDLGDGAPAGLGHDRRGRVLQGRNAVQRPRGAGAAGRLDRLGPHAVPVHGDAFQAQPQHARDRLDHGVAQALDQDPVARARRGRERDRDAVVAAVGHDDPLRRHLEAAARQPFGAGHAVLELAGGGLIAEQGGGLRVLGQRLQGRSQEAVARARRGNGDAQIDRRRVRVAPVVNEVRLGTLRSAHVGAAPDLAAHQAAPLGLGVSAAHGAHGDAEPPGQIAVGRQALAGLETAGGDLGGERVGDGGVARPGAAFQVGLPICHGDNVCIDSLCREILSSKSRQLLQLCIQLGWIVSIQSGRRQLR